MANITKQFTIPEALVPELIEVFGQTYVESTDGETKAQFASRMFDEEVKQYVRRRVVEYRKVLAKQTVSEDFDINIV